MPPKNKSKLRSPGKDTDSPQNFGLLDAYTDTTTPGAVSKDEGKPVTKKNKNMKKREAERLRQMSQSEETKEGEGEVIDSWEDLESNADDTQIPRTIEFPISKPSMQKPAIEKASSKASVDSTLLEKLSKLQLTLDSIGDVFSRKETEEKKKPALVEVKAEVQLGEVKAEREAKRQAKAAAKEAAKSKSQKPSEPPQQSKTNSQSNEAPPEPSVVGSKDRSPEEIKAEREAKKKAKAAAKEMAKDKTLTNKPEKPDKSEDQTGGKSKAELKAERRAKQEEQRAKKAAEASKKEAKAEKVNIRVPDEIQADRASVEKKLAKKLASQQIPPRTKAQRKVMLFSHLHQYEREFSLSTSYPVVGAHIHPSIMTLGLQYADGIVTGSNARCVALLKAMKEVICDYSTPENSEIGRDLNNELKPQITFLKECRPISVSMGNAIRALKGRINNLPSGISDSEAKESLYDFIDEYVQHNIDLAAKQIAITACEKICDGDVILTYGCSSLLRQVFTKAFNEGRSFRVIVADGRPKFEGKEMVRRMVSIGLQCTYVLVTSVPYIIQEVTKVFVGAHAVLANGCVMSRVGTSQVALVAKAHNVPVLICCETYKFSERVQTDSFVFNELGDPDDLVDTGLKVNPLEDWRDFNALTLLNLTYDVTPASLVDAIISEISVIPGTSVPVVLRLKNNEHPT